MNNIQAGFIGATLATCLVVPGAALAAKVADAYVSVDGTQAVEVSVANIGPAVVGGPNQYLVRGVLVVPAASAGDPPIRAAVQLPVTTTSADVVTCMGIIGAVLVPTVAAQQKLNTK